MHKKNSLSKTQNLEKEMNFLKHSLAIIALTLLLIIPSHESDIHSENIFLITKYRVYAKIEVHRRK